MSEFLQDLEILEHDKWPNNTMNTSIRHGEKEIRRPCNRFNLQTEQGIRDFIDNPTNVSKDLKPLHTCILSIPCSSSGVRGVSV